MKKINYSLLVVAAIVSFSCAKSQIEKEEVEEISGPTVTVTCDFAQPDTKVNINDANGKTTWKVGDQISIHGKYFDKSVIVTLAAENIVNEGKKATFTVTLPTAPYGVGADDAEKEANPDGYYAVYPASAAIADDASNHGYYYCAFSNTNLPLLASYYKSDTHTFTFYNLCGIMSFIVDGDYDSYEFEGKNKETVGYGHYTVKITTSSQSFNYTSHTKSPMTAVSGTVVADGVTPNLICFPNGVTFAKDSGFDLYLLKGGLRKKKLSYTVTAEEGLSIARNKYRPVGDITDHLEDASTPKHDHGLEGTFKEDLSATASANSYIINAGDAANAGKLFKFKAYKGKSTQNVGAIKSVEVLWRTDNTGTAVGSTAIVEDVSYDYQVGNTYYEIYLKTPSTFTAGNALIAAKDVAGNILWSWHIWAPADAITDIAATDFCGASYIMDRNLGALNDAVSSGDPDASTIGLYYQWGRKDPFPGHASFAANSAAALTGEQRVKQPTQISTDFSISHPTYYAYTPSQDSQNWNTENITTLWENSGKTIYDPCPPTYRVPVRNSAKPMYQKSNTNWTFPTNCFVYDNTYAFPISGYVDCWSGNYEKTALRGVVWSATVMGSKDSYSLYYKEGTINPSSDYPGYFSKAKAANVRCVKEE